MLDDLSQFLIVPSAPRVPVTKEAYTQVVMRMLINEPNLSLQQLADRIGLSLDLIIMRMTGETT